MALCRFSAKPEAMVVPPSTAEEREHLALFCKALAHPARVQIVQFLAGVDTCFCGDIVKQLPLAQSTVSQHLKILKEAGIVQGEIDGPRTCYWLSRDRLAQLKSLISQLP
jgi:ArsR family transcriptional regulator, arsenate/arsenite/antimonite-responsive transcriptional repressor